MDWYSQSSICRIEASTQDLMDRLDDLVIYQMSMELGDRLWNLVKGWPEFERRTIGTQFARSADSVGANIAEGYGRYHYGEKRQFSYYVRGSLTEVACERPNAITNALLLE